MSEILSFSAKFMKFHQNHAKITFWRILVGPWPPHAENLVIPIGILRFSSSPGGLETLQNTKNGKISPEIWKMRKNHEISPNFVKFHEISRKYRSLSNLLYSGGSETLIFLRKNNDLGAGPPKDPLLAKFPQNSWNSSILSISSGKWLKSEKKVILEGFCDFRSDRTPPEPMNLLCISMVWGAFGRLGARRGAFSTFYVKSWKFIKNHDNSGKS